MKQKHSFRALHSTPRRAVRGYFVILVLVFSAVFLTLLSALTGYIFVQKQVQLAKENQEKALHLAEAGLEYYKWFLAHFPEDTTDGTGAPGPYVHPVPDPEGESLGTFSLDINADVFCGTISSLTITSTGIPASDPTQQRTIEASYVRPSVALYSHIVDDNVWAGADRVIQGPYHSNKGVRMDGNNNAEVTSGVSTWECTSTFGCSGTDEVPGVFSEISPHPGRTDLWSFPAPSFDFADITVKLDELESYALAEGVFLEEETTHGYGYHISFVDDGSPRGAILSRRVTNVQEVWGYSTQFGWEVERSVVTGSDSPTTIPIPEDCPVIYVEDDIWIDGTVAGKALIAASDISEANNPSVVVNGDLVYANADEDGLTVIGENNILVGLQVPNVMNISGIFIAQKGRFGRNHYCANDCSGGGGSGNSGYETVGATPVSTGWSNFTSSRLSSSNNQDASCDATCDNNDNGQMGNFDLNLPEGAEVTGVQVSAEMAEGSSSGDIDVQFSLSWNAGSSFTTTRTVSVNGTSDSTYTAGGSSDTWGRVWSASDFANSSFRLKLDKLPDADTLYVDYVRVRVYYETGNGLPSFLDGYVTRSTLNTTGTVVSKHRVGTKWTSGGSFVSGFSQRNDSFDQNLSIAPPPFTPAISEDYRLHSWKELE